MDMMPPLSLAIPEVGLGLTAGIVIASLLLESYDPIRMTHEPILAWAPSYSTALDGVHDLLLAWCATRIFPGCLLLSHQLHVAVAIGFGFMDEPFSSPKFLAWR
jgi:hypothetical protein